MKKAVCLCLSLILVLCFSGCKSNKNKSEHSVDIGYFADMGAQYESDLKIGDSVPEKKEGDETFFFTESGKESFVSNGDFCYYYDANQKEPKIYGIAAFSNCMGFETGAVSIEVTDALESQGIEYRQRAPKDGEIFFLPAAENREVIECQGLKHNLIFVLEDNALCASFIS